MKRWDRQARGKPKGPKFNENEHEITPEEKLMKLQKKLLTAQSLRECTFDRKDAIRLNTFINIYREFYSLTAAHKCMITKTHIDSATQLNSINIYQNLQSKLILEQHSRLEAVVSSTDSSLFVPTVAPSLMPVTFDTELHKPSSGRRAKAEPANYTAKPKRKTNKKK